jgi:enolase-phosphatase E1
VPVEPTQESTLSGILLDVEGTTTPIDFVYGVLFPYARARVRAYFSERLSTPEGRAIFAELSEERAADVRRGLAPPALEDSSAEAQLGSAEAYVHWLMDQDRKSAPLKSLQGKVWEEGYRSGEIRGQVFNDVPTNLRRWHEQRKAVCIFSSGSVLAQRLLFSHSTAGDLSPFIQGYFDTQTGGKTDPYSYERIARAMGLPPSALVFVSDVTAELDAARGAGMHTLLSLRPGNHPQPAGSTHKAIKSLDEVPASALNEGR